jgi:tRNA dimethylallyltransferase
MEKVLHVIVGPTASGKTNFAIRLAQKLQSEIISADARQFYRGMDIGTAKPSPSELALAPHHFISHRDPQEDYSAGDFERDALALLDQLFLHHQQLIVVGGSGLYIKALCEGMDEMPPVNIALRNQLKEGFDLHGISWLQEQLRLVQPEKLQTIDIQNPQRLMRAIEMANQGVVLQKPKKPRNFQIKKYAILWEREALYLRINQRVDLMIEQGLLEEAKSLYPLKNLNALQTVGYTELFDYFEGKTTLAKAIELIKQHTRNYAKRQMTWFKADPTIQWIPVSKISETLAQLGQTE